MPAVLRTIYLLFNEGYYSITQNLTLRKDFCLEALRLCTMLVENESTNTSEVNALLALMCFHFSRFDARLSGTGEIILYDEQETSLWNTDFISKGGYFLKQAGTGNRLTKYHLEAALAYWNTQKSDTQEKWDNILNLYDALLQLEYSPIAALNRTFALSKANGKRQALAEAEKLTMPGNQFYFALLGELYTDLDNVKAVWNFQEAISLSKTPADRIILQRKIEKINRNI
jgi:RNA polymerase sigma-70 factor (ECF subfamily)